MGVNGPLIIDYLGQVSRYGCLLVGLLLTLVASRAGIERLATEVLGTLMMLVAGLMLVCRANELVFLFVALELISIPAYVLLFLGRHDRASGEATIKYFFLSILASALLLYGMSFLYGVSQGTTIIIGTTGVPGIREAIAHLPTEQTSLFLIGLVLVVAGLGFKIAAVPFHFYAPDVYQGTTNINAGLLAVAPKIAGILALIRLVLAIVPADLRVGWQLMWVLAIVTMTLGNVCALWQTERAPADGLLVHCARRLHVDRFCRGLGIRFVRGNWGDAVLPGGVCAGGTGGLRGVGLSERRPAGSESRVGAGGTGPFASLGGSSAGRLSVLAGRDPAPGRILGQADVVYGCDSRGAGRPTGRFRLVSGAGRGGCLECGHRRRVLLARHQYDVLHTARDVLGSAGRSGHAGVHGGLLPVGDRAGPLAGYGPAECRIVGSAAAAVPLRGLRRAERNARCRFARRTGSRGHVARGWYLSMTRARSTEYALGKLLEASPRAVYVIDEQRQIVYCNTACGEMLGVACDQLIGQRCVYQVDSQRIDAGRHCRQPVPPTGSFFRAVCLGGRFGVTHLGLVADAARRRSFRWARTNCTAWGSSPSSRYRTRPITRVIAWPLPSEARRAPPAIGAYPSRAAGPLAAG